LLYLPCGCQNREHVSDSLQETILVVDDEPTVLNLCRVILTRGGYRVLEAANGVDALRVSQSANTPISLALLDVMMPGMNGFDVAKQLRFLKPPPPILLMSGYSVNEVRNVAGGENPYRVVWKPFKADSLLRMIQTMLDNTGRENPK
jgi:two-component system cell cycle sensor histidine kinase/response regulator CckA